MKLQCQNNSFTIFGFFDYLLKPSELNRITSSFSEYSPSFLNEMTPLGPANAIRLEKKEEGIVLVIRPNSVIITRTIFPTIQFYNIDIVKEFCDMLKDLLLKIFPTDYSGNRVAIRTQCFVLDPTNDFTKNIVMPVCNNIPTDIHINLNNPVQIEDDTLKETLNVVRYIDSAKATANISNGKTAILNALSIRTDINTLAEKSETRFSSYNIELILKHLIEQNNMVLQELSNKLSA